MTDSRPDEGLLPYLQIVEDLRGSIARGDIEPGGKLPSNAELKRKYEVASQTAQNAINALKTEGLVYGVAGRGVFVRSDLDVVALRDSIEPGTDTTDHSLSEVLSKLSALTKKVDDLSSQVELLEERVKQTEGGK